MDYVSKIKLGIIGGGQLGKMLILSARALGFYEITILDPDPKCPASKLADFHIIDKWNSPEGILKLSKKSDIITYEVEHTNEELLKKLEIKYKKIYPSAKVLEIINNKLSQKQFLLKNNLPTAKLIKINPKKEDFEKIKLPVVQKTCRGGYDGRGVLIIKNKKDIQNIFEKDSFLEKKVSIQKELAMLVARATNGEIKTYPLVEMYFNEKNICDMVIVPARVNSKIHKLASEIATECIKKLNGVGIFAIEMFLTENNEVLINEISPRVHNSGHYTIEATKTSQFEQHLRAISGLPLGSTQLLTPAVMVNLLGEPDFEGEPIIEGLREILTIDGLKFHFYDKSKTFPYRKMGHITILDKSLKNAISKALKVKKILKIKSNKSIIRRQK
ncbi:MAG: 5-(carboxyamino)imidazole ribonucleotide synthase [Endomicrobia bacterium]|nr:5-(carboxyamino)imidazole ribonucleotide synthase [Endomicrobiia bacterium]